jgi:hypothetical protein
MIAMTLREFDNQLREITPIDARPFLCEGSPLDCEVFLVGLNPRTTTPFWPYWDVSYGCKKGEWLKAYMAREGGLGRTREYIEILFKAFQEVKCLETNLFPSSSKRLAELPSQHRTPQVFNFLLQTIKPRMLFVHGREARNHMEHLGGRSLALNELTKIRLAGGSVYVYARHHLSFQLSKAACRALGERLREAFLRPN